MRSATRRFAMWTASRVAVGLVLLAGCSRGMGTCGLRAGEEPAPRDAGVEGAELQVDAAPCDAATACPPSVALCEGFEGVALASSWGRSEVGGAVSIDSTIRHAGNSSLHVHTDGAD